MRIGIDAHILGKGKGGVERVVEQMVRLLPGFMPEATFVAFINKSYVPRFAAKNLSFRRLAFSDPVIQRSVILPWLCWREKLDVLHVQRAAPLGVKSKVIVHTHDLLPLTHPSDHSGWRDAIVRRMTRRSLMRADRILTVSDTVAREITTLFPSTTGKVDYILNGIDTTFFNTKSSEALRGAVHQRLGLSGDYILYLGALMPRKNLDVAIEGFSAYLRAPNNSTSPRQIKLVIAGMTRSSEYEAKLRALASKSAPDNIVFAGFLSDDECLDLLQHSKLFLAPSRGEGFDLPALEAMACGIPVICSDLDVHRELMESDAIYFSTNDHQSLALSIQNALEGPSAAIDREKLRARALRYSWQTSMGRLADLYRSLFPRHAPISAEADLVSS